MLPPEERNFFASFDAALAGNHASLLEWIAPGHRADGLAVYRNTVMRGAIDALEATFGTVVLITGRDWFRAAAREFVGKNPPREPALMAYGEGFPGWLADFGPAQDTPYLSDIAEIDWLWQQAWSAADAVRLDGTELAALTPQSLPKYTLELHPSVRVAQFDIGTPSLWLAHQIGPPNKVHVLSETPERMLFVRSQTNVETHLLEPASHAFLTTLREQASLLEAAEAAMAAQTGCDLQQTLVTGLTLGLFTRLLPITRNDRHDH